MANLNEPVKPPGRQGEELSRLIKTISQTDINLYADASGDHNPIHIDPVFAAKTLFGGTIAHGMLVLAYVSEMMTTNFGESWLASGKLNARFKAPARPGDTITVSGKIDSIKSDGAVSFAQCTLEVRNQVGQMVITADAAVKLPDAVRR